MANYNNAKSYSQNHLTSDEIRKIQQYLKYSTSDARWSNPVEYYKGDINGVFDENTYNAILQYQKDKGLQQDGMWGRETDELSKLLVANRGAWKDREATARDYYSPGRQLKPSDYQRVIQKALSSDQALSDFWSSNNSALREELQASAPGILETIYDNTPESIRASIGRDKLTTSQKVAINQNGIRNATERVAPIIPAVAASPMLLGSAVATPVATLLGVAGGVEGARIGGNTGERWGQAAGRSNENYGYTQYGLTGNPESVVNPNAEYAYGRTGRGIGTAVGGIAGATAGYELGIHANPKLPY